MRRVCVCSSATRRRRRFTTHPPASRAPNCCWLSNLTKRVRSFLVHGGVSLRTVRFFDSFADSVCAVQKRPTSLLCRFALPSPNPRAAAKIAHRAQLPAESSADFDRRRVWIIAVQFCCCCRRRHTAYARTYTHDDPDDRSEISSIHA